MSVDAVRRSYEAFARHDLDGALAMMDEDIVWHQAQGLPHGGVYHGLAEVRANVFDPIDDSWWVDFKADPEEVIGVGEDVRGGEVADTRARGLDRVRRVGAHVEDRQRLEPGEAVGQLGGLDRRLRRGIVQRIGDGRLGRHRLPAFHKFTIV